VKLSENEQATARTSMIPLEAIDHIEITKGGNSVLYGDGATSGTINIVTKRNTGNLTVATAGIGSYAGLQGSLYHAQDFGMHQLSLFAKSDSTNGYRQNSRTTEESAGLNWATNFNANDRIGLRILTNKEMDHLPGALPLIYLNTSPQNSEVPGYQYNVNTNTNAVTLFGNKKVGNVEFSLDMSQRIKTVSTGYRYDAQNIFTGYSSSLNPYPPSQPQPYAFSQSSTMNDTQSVNPRVRISDLIINNNTLITGFDWSKTDRAINGYLTNAYTPTDISNSLSNAGFRTTGWYLRDDWQINSSDRITVGFRNQTYNENKLLRTSSGSNPWATDISPWSASGWSQSGQTTANEIQYSKSFYSVATAYIRLGQNFRLPNVDDNSSVNYQSVAPYSPIFLMPQTSHDIDVGLNTNFTHWKSEFKYFRSDIQNEIGYDPAANGGYGGNVNYSPTHRDGIELKELVQIGHDWNSTLNLQILRAHFSAGQYSGNTIPNTSRLSGNWGLNYLINSHQQVGITTRFSEAKFASGDFLNNQSQVPGYMVADLSYRYQEKTWSLVGSINNIFNKNYADIGIFKPYNSGDGYYYIPPYNLTTYPNPGRNFSLLGRYSF
jgi:iron complex outermembrane receptor protein